MKERLALPLVTYGLECGSLRLEHFVAWAEDQTALAHWQWEPRCWFRLFVNDGLSEVEGADVSLPIWAQLAIANTAGQELTPMELSAHLATLKSANPSCRMPARS